MSLEKLHLNKLVALCHLPPKYLTPALRSDIRRERDKEQGKLGSGPDFYVAFWGDAKKHAVGMVDLHDAVAFRIQRNAGRRRLYNQLRTGFLAWWDNKRRWTNEPFKPIEGPAATLKLDDETTLKIEDILAVKDARDEEHFVYPYFNEHAPLVEESALLCLWALRKALPQMPENELRVLDVLRGEVFSLDRTPLRGTEEAIFMDKLQRVRERRNQLRRDYDW